jgi:hypothetical protein
MGLAILLEQILIDEAVTSIIRFLLTWRIVFPSGSPLLYHSVAIDIPGYM